MHLQASNSFPDGVLAMSASPGQSKSDRSVESVARRTEDVQESRRPRALIVDDATDVTEMIAVFLKHAGYDAVMAFSAPAALDAVKDDVFDIIVSDIGMPGMNGYQLAESIRSTPGYEKVPMIAVTGFSLYDDRGRALQSGFNAHLSKPINPMALLELMDRLRV
jgi:CheY-like chemotaxis protein